MRIGPPVDTFGGAPGERNARRYEVFGHAFLATDARRPAVSDAAQFDAGRRGCADGLAGELRDRLRDLPAGEHLQITVRDPAAKADLPSVARLLGHRVLSEEPLDDGRLVITVEKRT